MDFFYICKGETKTNELPHYLTFLQWPIYALIVEIAITNLHWHWVVKNKIHRYLIHESYLYIHVHTTSILLQIFPFMCLAGSFIFYVDMISFVSSIKQRRSITKLIIEVMIRGGFWVFYITAVLKIWWFWFSKLISSGSKVKIHVRLNDQRSSVDKTTYGFYWWSFPQMKSHCLCYLTNLFCKNRWEANNPRSSKCNRPRTRKVSQAFRRQLSMVSWLCE